MTPTYQSPAQLAAQCLRDDPSFAALSPAEQRGEARSALALINGCDPDDLDLQLETIALASAPVTQRAVARIVDTGRKRISVAAPAIGPEPAPEAPASAPDDVPATTVPDRSDRTLWVPQPCRKPAACTESLAGTGRCLQCGAQRKQPKDLITRPVAENPAEILRPDPVFNKKPPPSPKATRKVTKVSKLNAYREMSPEGFARRRLELSRGNLLHRVKALTNAPDHYLARVLGRSRASIQAYLSERVPFNANVWQLGQLQQMLLQQRVMLDDALDTIEAAVEGARKR